MNYLDNAFKGNPSETTGGIGAAANGFFCTEPSYDDCAEEPSRYANKKAEYDTPKGFSGELASLFEAFELMEKELITKITVLESRLMPIINIVDLSQKEVLPAECIEGKSPMIIKMFDHSNTLFKCIQKLDNITERLCL